MSLIQTTVVQRLADARQAVRREHMPAATVEASDVRLRWPFRLVAAVGTAAACTPLVAGGAIPVSSAAVLLSVAVALGVAGGAFVARPVTMRPVGASELGLRVGVVVVALSVALVVGAAGLGQDGGVAPRSAAFTVANLGLLLAAVAIASWKVQSRSHVIVLTGPGGVTAPAIAADGPVGAPLPPLCALFKRTLDLVVAGTTLVVMLPVLVSAAVAIVVESPGGWLFSQTRLGADGRPFRMFKLRTMSRGNDDSEHRAYVAAFIRGDGAVSRPGLYKLTVDPRRTRVGAVLRHFSIDELPQLWNVIRGDMSVVGPRPPLPSEAELYDHRAWRRMAAKPGLTGLWQVSGRSRLSFAEMIELDVRYWVNWTPLSDLKILALTPKVVLWSKQTA
jgi:lipopolysaccharide/colanic/teichoic acid biosynthesis glycosyltransferase